MLERREILTITGLEGQLYYSVVRFLYSLPLMAT